MTDADQGKADLHNVSQESGFEQEEEDAHVTLTTVHDTQKTEGPMQSSSVSSNFIEKLLNFENISPADNKIASLMDTTVRTEEPSNQTSNLFTVPITVIPTIIPLPPYFFNPFPQQTTPSPTPTTSEATTAAPVLPDFASVFRFNNKVTNLERDLSEIKQVNQEDVKTQLPQILPKAVSKFATPVIKQNVTESLEAAVLARYSSQPKSTYEAAASLSEYELTKILLDKMEESKSHLRADYKKELYDALVKSYNTDKDLFNTYGEFFTLKMSQDDKDKDQDPSVESDRGTKRRKSSKEAESQKDPRSKEGRSSSSSKDTSRSHHKSSGKFARAEEPSHTVDDSGVQKNQEFDTGNNDEQPEDKAAPKNDWFKKTERHPTPDPDWNKRQHVDFRPPQTWISVTTRAEKPPTSFDELIDTPIDFSAFVMNQLNITNLTQELLNVPRLLLNDSTGITQKASRGSLSRKHSTSVTKTKAATYEIKWIEDLVPNLWSHVKVVYDKHAYWGTSHWVTRLKIMKKYDYGYLDKIEVRREDHQLYTFKEDERYDLNMALCMFTRRIIILRRMEDLQLGVKSYQKKINLTKPDTFRTNFRNRTTYSAYSDPHEVIYKDQNNRNRLMRADELHKFSDGMLNDVRTALHDIASGIRMEYLPRRKWSGLDKRRARVMLQDIDKHLFQRRLMRNLEKFVGGREYGNDLRLLERTI
ncbi:hypothetical protein Tco_0973443 [Tanacetum coccineum]